MNEATNPRGTVFANWLAKVGALSQAAPPEVTISDPRHDLDAVNPGAVDWIDGNDPQTSGSKTILHYAFDLPWGQASQCGRTVYSDFHVENKNQVLNNGITFPLECTPGPMSSQEKTLEYMIWDLASCVPPPSNPSPPSGGCTPRTCQDQHLGCGPAGDGCGNVIACGDCAAPQTCGGGGASGQCGVPAGDAGAPPSCTPRTCASQGAACGPTGDGCGNLLQCGTCPLPTTCGGGGLPAQCGGAVIN